MKDTIKPGKYRHFKGNEYEVIGTANHSETMEEMVVYRALYGDGGLWVRPASMWNETVERDGKTYKRFTYIGEDEPECSGSRKGAGVELMVVLEAFEDASNNWTLYYDLANHETMYIFESGYMDDEEERELLKNEPERFIQLPKKQEIYADPRVDAAVQADEELDDVFNQLALEWIERHGLEIF